MHSSDNLVVLLTILESIEKATRFTQKFDDPEAFLEADDQLHYLATTYLLLVIGEETRKLDAELLAFRPEIKWKTIIGMRHILAHDYRGTDPFIVFETARDHLPMLKSALLEMLDHVKIDLAELREALDSPFYSNVQYLRKRLE